MPLAKKLLVVFVVILGLILIIPVFLKIPEAQFELPQNAIADSTTSYSGQFVTLNDYTTYVEDINPASDQVITFLHGFGGSTYTWRDNKQFFVDQGYRVILIDLKGFGLSQKGSEFDYSHGAQAELVKNILNYLNISSTIVVGHSMGGNIAATFTQNYPEMVSKLVLVDAGIVDKANSQITKVFDYYPFKNWLEFGLSNYFTKDRFAEFLKSAYNNKDVVADSVVNNYYLPLQIKGWQDSLLGITRDGYQNALPKALSEITTPTVIIWGEKDPWINISKGKEINQQIKDSVFYSIDNAGHLPMEEYPDKFNNVLLEYLNI